MHNFAAYTATSTSDLFERLAEVTANLANLAEEIAMIEANTIRERAHVLQTSGETSSNGRRDRVNMAVVEGPATTVELEGQRDAFVEEKFFIIRILDSRR